MSASSFTSSSGASFMIAANRIALACMQRRPASVPSENEYVGFLPPDHFCQNSVPER